MKKNSDIYMRLVKSGSLNFLLILCMWGFLYIPGLGNPELNGEEARRILPARNMLNSGDFLVMRIGGKIYKKKPPMISWAIAGTFKIFEKISDQNEFLARLPSVLSILIACLVLNVILCRLFDKKVALLAVTFLLSSKEIILKGRSAEIEVLLVSLTTLAMFSWLYFYLITDIKSENGDNGDNESKVKRSKNMHIGFIISGIFLGLAMLTKGIVPAYFYYVFVVCILIKNNETKKLISLSHLLGICVSFGLFLAWAIPNNLEISNLENSSSKVINLSKGVSESKSTLSVWYNELAMRIVPKKFDFLDWLKHPFEAVLNFFPWILFLPIVFLKKFSIRESVSKKYHNVFQGVKLSILISFFSIAFLPGTQGRFTMPLIPVCAVMLAIYWHYNSKSSDYLSRIKLKVWGYANYTFFIIIFGLSFVSLSLIKVNISKEVIIALILISFFAILFFYVKYYSQLVLYIKLIFQSICVFIMGIFLYSIILMPLISKKDNVRSVGNEINSIIKNNTDIKSSSNYLRLYKPYPSYQPFIFYLKNGYYFCMREKDFNNDRGFTLFFYPRSSNKVSRRKEIDNLLKINKLKILKRFSDIRGSDLILTKGLL